MGSSVVCPCLCSFCPRLPRCLSSGVMLDAVLLGYPFVEVVMGWWVIVFWRLKDVWVWCDVKTRDKSCGTLFWVFSGQHVILFGDGISLQMVSGSKKKDMKGKEPESKRKKWRMKVMYIVTHRRTSWRRPREGKRRSIVGCAVQCIYSG
jgi:hypothetical protein